MNNLETPPRFEDNFPDEAKMLQEVYASTKKPFKNCRGEALYFPVGFSMTLFKTQEQLADGVRIAYKDWKYVGVQRNDPCPCGSGKKFKKCCLN